MALTTKETNPTPTRLQIALWAGVMLATLVLLLYDWNGYQVGTYGDDGSYIAVTDSLLRGVDYGTLLDLREDDPTQFPFIYPLTLAPFRAFFPLDMNALRIVSVIATLAAMAVLFWGWGWIGRGLGYWWGLAVITLTALSPVTILHGRTVMSEALALLLFFLLALWTEYTVSKAPRAWGILFGLLSVTLIYTRIAAVVFVVAALVYLVWRMRRAALLQLGIAAASAAALLILIIATTSVRPVDLLPNEYMEQLRSIYDTSTPGTRQLTEQALGTQSSASTAQPRNVVERVALGLWFQLDFADKLPYQLERAIISTTDDLGISFVRRIPFLVLAALFVGGVVAWFRRTGLTIFMLGLPAYGLLLMAWAWQGPRLVYPIQPQVILALLMGIVTGTAWLAGRVGGNRERVAAWVLAIVTGLWLVMWVWLDLNLTQTMLLPGDQIARAAILQRYLPAGARVLSTRAEVDYLYSPLEIYDFPRGLNAPELVQQYLRDYQFDYVVAPLGVGTSAENKSLRISRVQRFVIYIQPLIKEGFLVETYSDPVDDLAIYRIK